MSAEATHDDACATDALFGGLLRFRQPRRGHRIGTDTVLLAALAAGLPGTRVLDFGSGVGGLGVTLAKIRAEASVILVEREASLAALVQHNAILNGVAERIAVVTAPVEQLRSRRLLQAGAADLVVSNPPFHDPVRHRGSPDDLLNTAHLMAPDMLQDWTDAAAWALQPRGRIALIYRADALGQLLRTMEQRFGNICVRPVHPTDGAAAGRVLVSAVRGSKAPLRILPSMILHDEDGGFTPLATALHRGEFAAYPPETTAGRRGRPASRLEGPSPIRDE